MIRLSDDGKIFVAVWRFVAIEFEAEFAKQLWGDVGRFEIAVQNFGSDFDKTIEIESVIFDGLLGTARFDFECFEKIFN